MNTQSASGLIAARRCSSSPASRRRPRSRSAARESAPPSTSADSITITNSSAGNSAATARIFANCSASSTNTARDSECPSTYWHSSAEFVW